MAEHTQKTSSEQRLRHPKAAEVTYIALSVSMMVVCSWIQIPLLIPFTLQTFAVFTITGLLGTRRSVTAMLVYLLLGVIGIPVFSGFRGGVGVLLSATGGYIFGFVFSALVTGLLLRRSNRSFPALIGAMLAGLAVCYLMGTAWYALVYASGEAFGAALTVCVLPYIPIDACKIVLSAVIVRKLRPLIHL